MGRCKDMGSLKFFLRCTTWLPRGPFIQSTERLILFFSILNSPQGPLSVGDCSGLQFNPLQEDVTEAKVGLLAWCTAKPIYHNWVVVKESTGNQAREWEISLQSTPTWSLSKAIFFFFFRGRTKKLGLVVILWHLLITVLGVRMSLVYDSLARWSMV